MTSAAPSIAGRAAIGIGTSLIGGVLLGGAAWLSDQLAYPWGVLIPANSIGVWVAVAFVLGAVARTLPTGAMRGLIGLLVAVVAYYALTAAFAQGYRQLGASHAALTWGRVAFVVGPVLGAAGAIWRHGEGWPRAISAATLGAALIAESVVFGGGRIMSIAQNGSNVLSIDPGAVLLAIEGILGFFLPFVLLKRGERLKGYLAVTVMGAAGLIVLGPIVTLLRIAADRF